MSQDLLQIVTGAQDEFLRDESRRSGSAEQIAFAKSESDICAVLAAAAAQGGSVTVQGARTGITAGAVPAGGIVLNLSKMKRITGLRTAPNGERFFVTVQPGVLLSELRDRLAELDFDTTGWTATSLAALEKLRASPGWFFPPDPTETSASLGGMVSCNASGARSFRFGPTSDHVESIRVVLASGEIVALSRGACRAQGNNFAVPTESGATVSGELPKYELPQVKSAAGYRVAKDMDMLELFCGMEGTLGVISQIECALTPLPLVMWGLMCFMPSQSAALSLVRALRGETVESESKPPSEKPVALEFFNRDALALLRDQKRNNPAFSSLTEPDEQADCAVYVELHGSTEDQMMLLVEEISELISQLGGDPDEVWLADSDREMEKLKAFRHALPEAVNLLIDQRRRTEPGLTKLGTDMSVPDTCLEQVMELYDSGLAQEKLESVIFGHIGNNHLHVNILPRTLEEYDRGKKLYLSWAQQVIAMGGSVSAEHGIGKLKTAFLRLMYPQGVMLQMKALRRVFDPAGVLNAGNLFD